MPLSRAMLISVLLLCAGLGAWASQAGGHVSDCHATHACPSDDHTYAWSDAAGVLWDCAAAGTVDYDPYLDTHIVTQGALTWYCRAPASPPPPPPPPPAPGAPAPGAPAPGAPAPGAPAPDPSAPPPAGAPLAGPLLALSDARSAVRRMIRANARRAARDLSYGCARVDASTFACRPSWSDSLYLYAGRTTVKADDAGTISSSFTGTRARRTCVGRYRTAKTGLRRCSRRVRW